MIYLLDETQIQQLNTINSQNNSKVIICDHGLGLCIENDFLNKPGYEAHTSWFNGESFEEAEMPEQSL
jgi:hypothetical protein